MNHQKLTSYAAASCTVVLWGISYIWIDRLLELAIPVEFFVPLRILLAGLLLLALNLLTAQKMRMQRSDVWRFALLSLCMPFVYFIAETYGQYFTGSPTITSLIIAMNPIFAMIVGLLVFKEKFGWANVIGVFITLAGLWMVLYTSSAAGEHFWLGIVILFVAVAAEVSQIAFTKSLSERYSPSVIVMYQFLIGSVFFLPMFLTKGLAHFDGSLYLSWDVIYRILALALLCSATAFTTWAYAIGKLGVARTSVFLAIVPMITALFCVIFGSESLALLQWVGLAVGMVGIYLTQKEIK